MRLRCIVNYCANFIINTEIKIIRENRKFSLILESHKGRPWLLAVSGWAGSPGVKPWRASMKVSWGVQKVTHNCHPALWRRRGKTQQPKAQVQSKQVLQVRMVKPGTPTIVWVLAFPVTRSICVEGCSTLMLTLPLTAHTQVCSVEKWESRKACALVLSPFVTLCESDRFSSVLRVICPEHRGLYREGNGLCIQKLEFFPPFFPPSTSFPWAAGISLM